MQIALANGLDSTAPLNSVKGKLYLQFGKIWCEKLTIEKSGLKNSTLKNCSLKNPSLKNSDLKISGSDNYKSLVKIMI